MDFSETFVVYVIKVGRCNQLNESFMSSKGQGHSLTLFKITWVQYFLNCFSSITAVLKYPQHSGKGYRTNGPLV